MVGNEQNKINKMNMHKREEGRNFHSHGNFFVRIKQLWPRGGLYQAEAAGHEDLQDGTHKDD